MGNWGYNPSFRMWPVGFPDEQRKKLVVLLQSYMGIIVNHYKDPS